MAAGQGRGRCRTLHTVASVAPRNVNTPRPSVRIGNVDQKVADGDAVAGVRGM
jgi:hypothetical protein